MNRCDRCCASAQTQIVTPSGDLLLCGHHLRQHADALAPFAWLPMVGRRVAGAA